MDLSQFHEDHAFLRCQAVRLHDLITRDEPAVDRAARLHAALHVLRARLALHLAIEDRFLYPQVEAAEPDELLGTAYDLRRALGHLDQSLSALMERFDHAAAIEKQPEHAYTRGRAG